MHTLTYTTNSQPETGTTRAGINRDDGSGASMESLAKHAGGIAHDINNMLSGILGSVSLAMMEMNSSDESHKFLEQAEDAIMRTRKLTTQLLSLDPSHAVGDRED